MGALAADALFEEVDTVKHVAAITAKPLERQRLHACHVGADDLPGEGCRELCHDEAQAYAPPSPSSAVPSGSRTTRGVRRHARHPQGQGMRGRQLPMPTEHHEYTLTAAAASRRRMRLGFGIAERATTKTYTRAAPRTPRGR